MIIVLRIQSIKFLLSVNNNTSFANEGNWVELNTFRKFREPRNPNKLYNNCFVSGQVTVQLMFFISGQ